MKRTSYPGKPYPLGATWDTGGTNFSIYSEDATKVELCLFAGDGDNAREERIMLSERTHQVWHGYLPEIGPGQQYGYRIHGPFEPEAGHQIGRASCREAGWNRSARVVER